MSKFVVHNHCSNNPVLQADRMVTTEFRDGTSTSVVTNGMLTNGVVMLPVNGTVKRYRDGRIEVDGQLIDWAAVVRQSEQPQQQQQQQQKLPDAMPDEPDATDGEKACPICLERATKTVIIDCGHQVYCVACAREFVKPGTACPLCRGPITSVIRVY